jgi:branched-subunit amino acid aminotransferase/4-amino-4-deoxychorismate lyase
MDRGLNYGDGLFETMRLANGSIRFLDSHLVRLRRGCERLRMSCPEELLLQEITRIAGDIQNAVLKIVLTRAAAIDQLRTPMSLVSLACTHCPQRILSAASDCAGVKCGSAVTKRWRA